MNVALTIAGSDSGGGAGIQADLKTFHQFGVFGTSAIVVVTAQNTVGVDAVHNIPASMVDAQIAAVAKDLKPSACKTGMLATEELVIQVAEAVESYSLPNCVVDPVMVATSGDRLLDEGAVVAIKERLLPLSCLITPNIPEARILTDMEITTVDDMILAAENLVSLGAGAVLIKGGHLTDAVVTDVLRVGSRTHLFENVRIDTRSTHGTGCTLSAAVTAGLATGKNLQDSVAQGLDFVHRAIESAPGLGSGNGPLNHFTHATRND